MQKWMEQQPVTWPVEETDSHPLVEVLGLPYTIAGMVLGVGVLAALLIAGGASGRWW